MPLSPKHFPPIVDVDNTSEMNWACHVCSFLLDGIIEMRRRNLKGVEGCVFALLIIYMHETHFEKDSEHEKARPPWIKYWKGERLTKRIRVEKKGSTGLLRQANQRRGATKKEKTSGLKIGKKELLASKLVKSMEMEDDPKGKKKHGKRKHVEDDDESEDESEDVSSESESEDDSSESESEGESSEFESESGFESEPDSEKIASEDENPDPPQHVVAEINPVNPQEGGKEGVDAMAAAQELIGGDMIKSNTNEDSAPIHEDVQVTPQDCGIEVVQATSAEEQIINANVDAQIHEDVQVTPQGCGIEVVQATSAEEQIIKQDLSKSNANVDAQIHEDVQATPQDSGIEVVQATSAEEELIRRELSNNITNLVVETHGEKVVINQQDSGTQELTLKDWCSKTDPKEDIPTNKEIEEQMNKSIMMVAEIALAQSKLGPPPSFKLCPEIDSQPEEEDQEPQKEDEQNLKGKEIEHQGTECKTPGPIIQDDRKTMQTRLYKWATKETEHDNYELLFNFKRGKEYAAMRYHFMSLGEKAEVEMTHSVLERYGRNFISATTGLPHDISTLENINHLHYIDENKMKSAPFLFAPILYASHWWLYVIDVDNKKFYAIDSLNPKSPGGDKNKLGRFVCSRSDAGACWGKTRVVGSHSLLPKYILVPRQPNAYDCGVYVLKYMDYVNPSILGKKNFSVPIWTEAELQEFREQYVEGILYHDDNYYRYKAIKVANSATRDARPSTALQSPYTQLNTADLVSGKSDASK
ncbi:hypothetical protein PIB30_019933 [Stylosanthes scabra]|uniref:Ubiquitin-like protease family profile domain-containing protein n=1 Tax=Stylosanthes scabra TaxID=79078 RepID=A0ABU6W7W7_9FABA|nr:hypothetical protein [Stylosanthes scabra]